MRELPADDMSILALVAEDPHLPHSEFVELLGRLTAEGQMIAHMIVKLESGRSHKTRTRSTAVRKAAEALLKWAKGNKTDRERVYAAAPASR